MCIGSLNLTHTWLKHIALFNFMWLPLKSFCCLIISIKVCIPTSNRNSLFNYSYFNSWVMVSHCGLQLHIPKNNGMEHVFVFLFDIYTFSLVTCLFQLFVLFNGAICFLIIRFWKFFIYPVYKAFTWFTYMIYKFFL